MTIHELLEKVGVTEDSVLKEHATMIGLSKISRYETECKHFEKKYNSNYEEIAARNSAMQLNETFEAADDLMDWEYARESMIWWKQRIA